MTKIKSENTRTKIRANDTLYIGAELRRLRKLKGLKLKEVEALLNESYQQIAEVERGVRKASLEKLLKYFAIYSVGSHEVISFIESKREIK